jgi:acyl-coenzyme A thioesterase PaaI-like protein
MTLQLQDDHYCFVCGKDNPSGLHLSFRRDGDTVYSDFIGLKQFQGYRDILHGGIISAILDEIIIHAAMANGFSPVTVDLHVRFKKPVKINQPVTAEGVITKKGSRIIEGKGRLIDSLTGKLLAEAEAKMLLITYP